MKKSNVYIDELIERLREIDPYKVIVFGSHAKGTFTEESDLDFVVVLNSEKIAGTFDEKMQRKLLIRQTIRELNERIPIDLVVYTKAEFALLQKEKISFINELNNSGKVVYEKTDKELA